MKAEYKKEYMDLNRIIIPTRFAKHRPLPSKLREKSKAPNNLYVTRNGVLVDGYATYINMIEGGMSGKTQVIKLRDRYKSSNFRELNNKATLLERGFKKCEVKSTLITKIKDSIVEVPEVYVALGAVIVLALLKLI